MTEDDRTGMVQVELSAEDITERSAKLASEELERERLLEKKRSHNREWNEQLRQTRDRIHQLAEEVDTGKAWVPAQAGLFEGDAENDSEPEPEPEEPPARRGRRGRRAAVAAPEPFDDASV